jgi:competence protein ComEC
MWDRTIEVMILTHGDEDHLGFFGEIMGIYDTQIIFFPDTPKNTATVTEVKEAIEAKLTSGAVVKQPILGQSISFPSGGAITLLSSSDKIPVGASENDRSIVFLLEFGQTRWLFTGDLEAIGEQQLLKDGHLPLVDVLKVGHHGSASSSTIEFLNTLQPSLAIISAGANNKYGHPADLVLENLRQIGSTVLRTDQLDGAQVWVSRTHFRE